MREYFFSGEGGFLTIFMEGFVNQMKSLGGVKIFADYLQLQLKKSHVYIQQTDRATDEK